MKMLEEILTYNEKFVADKKYEEFTTTKFPNKKMVILTCMDTRLVELLPRALNLRNGEQFCTRRLSGNLSKLPVS